MKFTTLAASEDVPALARRLYNPATPEAQREAERALLKANPRLADASARTAGAVLIVPDVAGTTPTSEARSEGELVVPILQAARDQLSAVAAALRGTVDDRRVTVRATIDQINSAPVRQLVSEEPAFQATLNEVANQANAEGAEIDELDALQQQAIAELGQDLDDLIRSVGGQPSPPPSGPSQPGPTPGPTRPTPTQPGPVQPTPSQPTPTPPTPTTPQPRPTQPPPTPVPTQPTPTPTTPQPRPTQPTPTPVPTQPSPTPATPSQPTPSQPTPTQPAPTQPAPTQPTPTRPTPAPAQPTPTRPIQPPPLRPGITTARPPAQPRSAPAGGAPAAPPSKQKRSRRPKR